MDYVLISISTFCLITVVGAMKSGESVNYFDHMKSSANVVRGELTSEQIRSLESYKSYIQTENKRPIINQLKDNLKPSVLNSATAAFIEHELALPKDKKLRENWHEYNGKFVEQVQTPCSIVLNKLGKDLFYFDMIPYEYPIEAEMDRETVEMMIVANICKQAVADDSSLSAKSFDFLVSGGLNGGFHRFLAKLNRNNRN